MNNCIESYHKGTRVVMNWEWIFEKDANINKIR